MRFLIGMIDDVEFYDRVLTENEVAELYNAPDPNQGRIIFKKKLADSPHWEHPFPPLSACTLLHQSISS